MRGGQMVEARITDEGFFISGHAKYNEIGYDIVCAAISSISQATALGLKKYGKGRVYSTKGWLGFESEEVNEIQLALIDTLRLGLIEIENEYPDHLQVITKRGVFK